MADSQVIPRPQWPPFAALAGTAALLFVATPLRPLMVLALAFIAYAVTWLLVDVAAGARETRAEEQLADSIELMVAALRAGASTRAALSAAAAEVAEPLRTAFERCSNRLALGDAPKEAYGELPRAVPLESMRVFAFTMMVHSETGGSLAATLRAAARSVRDRIEVMRRVRAQATEARYSVLGILGITYAIALLMWRANGENVAAFLTSRLGGDLAALAVAVQGIGLLWMARLSRLRF